jgi:hypothetical protein
MPGLKHQSIVQILRDEPQLVTMFLGRSGFRLPSGAMPVIVDSDLSHRDPGMLKELLSDNVFLYKGMEEDVAVVSARLHIPALRFRARAAAPSRRPVLRSRADHAARPHRHP